MRSKPGSKQKATSKTEKKHERPPIQLGRWAFLRMKYDKRLEQDDVVRKIVKDLSSARFAWSFAEVPPKEGTAVVRVDLEKSKDLTSIISAEVCAKAKLFERVVGSKSEKVYGWASAWGEDPDLKLTKKSIAKVRSRLEES